jgi:hypothetical protein
MGIHDEIRGIWWDIMVVSWESEDFAVQKRVS